MKNASWLAFARDCFVFRCYNGILAMTPSEQSGQMLVILLLVMVVGLTIGLFTLSRTTTDISVTTKLTDSTRAFNAAEAGIEEIIRSTTGVVIGSPVPIASGVTYTVTPADLGTGSIYPAITQDPAKVGEVFTVWLVPHDDTSGAIIDTEAGSYTQSTIDICYTTSSPTPAVGVTVFYKDQTLNKINSSYAGYDSDSSRQSTNHFLSTTTVGSCGGTNGYTYRATVNLAADFGTPLNTATITPLALRIRPVYASTSLAVMPIGQSLPKQGNDITSVGNAGETTRRIKVQEPYTVPAPFTDYILYSTGGDLSK